MRSCLYVTLIIFCLSLALGENEKPSFNFGLKSPLSTIKANEDKILILDNIIVEHYKEPLTFTFKGATDLNFINNEESINFGNLDIENNLYGAFIICNRKSESCKVFTIIDEEDNKIDPQFFPTGISLQKYKRYYALGGLQSDDETFNFVTKNIFYDYGKEPVSLGYAFPEYAYYGAKSAILETKPDWIDEVDDEYSEGGLLIFGRKKDEDKGAVASNDVYLAYVANDNFIIHDITLKVIDANEPDEMPKARYHHAMAYYDDKIYLFGGSTDVDDTEEDLDDFWVLNVETLKWTNIAKKTPWPPKRHGHTLTKIKDYGSNDVLILYGGRTKNGELIDHDSVWVYNLTTSMWKEYKNDTIIPRTFHNAVTLDSKRILLTNGFNEEDGNLTVSSRMSLFYLELEDMNTPVEKEEDTGNRSTPNHVIAGVAGGLFLVLLTVVIVLRLRKSG